MYYVVHKQENLTRTTIHLGMQDHLMAKGHSKLFFDQVKSLVEEEVSHISRAIVSVIVFTGSKTFLFEHLFTTTYCAFLRRAKPKI
jgi:hypothetical protein